MNKPLDSYDLQNLINLVDFKIDDLEHEGESKKMSEINTDIDGYLKDQYSYWNAVHTKLCAMQTEAFEREGVK